MPGSRVRVPPLLLSFQALGRGGSSAFSHAGAPLPADQSERSLDFEGCTVVDAPDPRDIAVLGSRALESPIRRALDSQGEHDCGAVSQSAWDPGWCQSRIPLRRYAVTHPPRVRSEWVTIPGVTGARPLRIHCRAAGSSEFAGRPVVLVQGFGIGSRYFEPLQKQVARYAPVYAPDLPGHGRSDHDRQPLTIAELAGALAAWMQIRGLGRAVLAGHSLGCQVVAEVASRRRDLVAGLVLLSPTTDPQARTFARLIARAAATALYEAPTLFIWLVRDYARAGPRLLLAEMRQLLEHQVENLLPTLPGPIRVVRGSRDRVVPQAWAERVARLSCAPPPRVVEGVAHAVHYAAPEDVAAIVREIV